MLISNAQFLFIIYLVSFNLNVIVNAIASAKCRQAEYRVGGECCPTCPPGMYVSRHCTEFRSTSCASCAEGTFQDGNTGGEQCFSCKHCAGLGLKVKKSCSSTSDAVCETLDGSVDCPLDGFRVNGRCCHPCPTGTYIAQNCREYMSTSCKRCRGDTFQDEINGRQCHSCTFCDAGLGLKVKRSCSSTSDAVCEVLDGFFCSDSNGGGCRAAQRHRVCSPGQYIGQRGTADKDTECPHCTDGTFSDGASSTCQSHRKCESLGLKLMKPATDSTDSECGEHGSERGYVAGIIPGVILVMILMALIIAIIHGKKKIDLADRSLDDATRKHNNKEEEEVLKSAEKSNLILDKELDRREEERRKVEGERELTDGAAGEETSGPSSTPLLSTELPAGLETSIPPAPSSETQPAGLETSIPPAPSSETQPAGLETSIPPAPSSETQPAGLETSIPPAPSSETQPAEVTTPLKSTDGPEPTREYTMNIPDGTIVDHHGDQSLGPAPPSSPTQDGSVSVSVHQEDHQPVLIKRDSGASRSSLL
ncbi:unnamed protein product, partial [Gadus morhua 'NCC']